MVSVSSTSDRSNSPSSSSSPTRQDALDQTRIENDNTTKKKATFLDGLKSIHPSDFTQVHKVPCARDSFLTGMGAGFCAGGLRLVFGGTPWISMTYSILSFSLVSVGAHTFCQRRRQLEQASMTRAAEIMSKKKEERAVKAAEMRAEREKRRAEHDKQKSAWGRMTTWFGGSISERSKIEGEGERQK